MLFSSWTLISSAALLLQQAAGASIAPRAPSAGCGTQHTFPGQTQVFTIASSGGTRSYRLHLPSNYQANDARPLLIVYHGSGNNPANFENESRFANETLNPNMITVFPAGVNGNWQGPTYATPGVNDEVFTTDLVNRVKSTFCIDTARVYAAGYSNGGGFVNTLACSPNHGGQFAGFASFAAALYTDVTGNERCVPSRSPLPVFEIHGTADGTIPYTGGTGRGGPLPAVQEWLGRWAARNNCGGSTTTDRGNGVTELNWTCSGRTGLQRHIRMQGQGHGYPGPTNGQLFATPAMLSFLSAQRKP